MPICYIKWITREFVRANPEARFVFGDNLERRGLGGQAKVMRGEPNAIGVATKRAPTMEENAFFADRFDELQTVGKDMSKVIEALLEKRTVYIPLDGIGSGLSQLPERSPKIDHAIKQMFGIFGRDFGILEPIS